MTDSDHPSEKFVSDFTELRKQAALRQLPREGEVIRAMTHRMAHWHGPLDIFWRRPWRSEIGIGWREGMTLRTKLENLYRWLRFAHDCSDPSVGCSCYPSYRFPAITDSAKVELREASTEVSYTEGMLPGVR